MDQIDLQSARAILAGVAGWAKVSGEGVSLATFAGFNNDRQFLVTLSDELEPIQALSTVGLSERDAGVKIVIAFEKGNVRRPVILGRVQESAARATVGMLKLDGDRVVLQAEREIELRCGEASIVLTRAGKILIRGNYVLTRSRGANKIKGAFVEIN